MLFDIDAEPEFERLDTRDYAVAWSGFLFVGGCRAGEESVMRLLECFRSMGPEVALASAKGSFALLLEDKRSGDRFCAVDPFGLFRLFVAEDVVCPDLVRLMRRLGTRDDVLDLEAIGSFFRFGYYILDRTLDRRIRALPADAILHGTRAGKTRVLRKQPLQAAFDLETFIGDLRRAVEGQSISLDLTGGFDSRVVAALLRHGSVVVAECATMGSPELEDVRIAAEVAARLELSHCCSAYEAGGFESRLGSLLRVSNGQVGVATYDHSFQLTKARRARGATLGISGIGGELWKDFWWLQDYPFLWGHPDFARLYRMRIEPRRPLRTCYTQQFTAVFDAAEQLYVAAMGERFGGLSRTAGYDGAYAYLRMPYGTGPWVTAAIRAGLPTFCPLLDADGVAASSRAPKRTRLLAAWHRKTIRQFVPEIADLRTTDGLSARGGLSALVDIPSVLHNRTGRLAQKISQRMGLPDVLRNATSDAASSPLGSVLAAEIEAGKRLRAAGILVEGVDPAVLPFALRDRLLTTGLTIAAAGHS